MDFFINKKVYLSIYLNRKLKFLLTPNFEQNMLDLIWLFYAMQYIFKHGVRIQILF